MTVMDLRRRGGRVPWSIVTLVGLMLLIGFGFLAGVLPADHWQPFLVPSTWTFLAEGLLLTLVIGGVSLVASLAISLPLALGRVSPISPIGWLAGVWIEAVRAIPVLVILVVVFFALLRLGVDAGVWAAIIGLTIYTSAVLAEIIRAGIASIPRAEVEAARSLGLSYAQAMRHVILPQAYANMTPAIVSQLITLIKDTSLAYIIAVFEIVGHGRSLFNFYGNPVETYLVLALIFFAINYPLSLVSRRLEAGRPSAARVTIIGGEEMVTGRAV